MMRSAIGLMLVFAVGAAAGCERRLSDEAGVVRLSLQVAPGGPTVSLVHWQILSASAAVLNTPMSTRYRPAPRSRGSHHATASNGPDASTK